MVSAPVTVGVFQQFDIIFSIDWMIQRGTCTAPGASPTFSAPTAVLLVFVVQSAHARTAEDLAVLECEARSRYRRRIECGPDLFWE